MRTRAGGREGQARVEYTVTELGDSIKPVLDDMWDWGEEYKAKNQQKKTEGEEKQA